MPQDKPPPPFLNDFVDGRDGWELTQRQDGGWLATRQLKMPSGWSSFILRLMPGMKDPAADRDWSVTVVDTDSCKASTDGSFDEVTAELVQFERTLRLLGQLIECSKREQAAELVESVRGQQLEFLRQAAGIPRGAAAKMRQQIVHRTCGARLDAAVLSDYWRWS